MTHALPALPHGLDAKRITATSGVIALHVLALMLMLAPVDWSRPATVVVDEPFVLEPPIKEIKEIKPPPVDVKPREDVKPKPLPQVHNQVQEEIPVISDETGPLDFVVPPVTPDIGELTFDPPPSGPVTLGVLFSPAPNYPSAAIRMGITGRVVLLIEVDANGHPISGEIETSSGSSILDKAALKAILAKWRFQPAQRNGQAVAATARVPIVFQLDQ